MFSPVTAWSSTSAAPPRRTELRAARSLCGQTGLLLGNGVPFCLAENWRGVQASRRHQADSAQTVSNQPAGRSRWGDVCGRDPHERIHPA